MCHSPRPSVLLARYDITTQPTGHAPLGDPYPTDPRLFFARSGSGLRQAIHRLGRQSPPHRNAVSIVPCCTPLWRHSWRTFSSSRAAKANRRTLCSPFLLQSDSNGVGQLALGPCLVFVCFVSTGCCRCVRGGRLFNSASAVRLCGGYVFFRFVQSIYVLAGTRRKESQSQPQTFDSPFSICLRYRILLSLHPPPFDYLV